MTVNEQSGAIFKFFIYLVVVVLINVAAYTLFFRIDLTANKVYSLSNISKKVVSTLSEPLTVNVFFSKNLPSPYNSVEQYLKDLLEEYAISGNRYFNYKFYNVSPQEGMVQEAVQKNQALAQGFGIRPVQIRVLEKDEVKFKMAYMGLAIVHGDMVQTIPALTSPDRIEYQLTTAMQKLNNKISAFLKLKKKIKLKLFLSSSLKRIAPLIGIEDLSGIGNKLKEVVEKLNRKSYGKLAFSILDPSKDPSLEKQVKKYGVTTLRWPDVPAKSIKAGKGSIDFIVEHGGKAVEIPLLNKGLKVENNQLKVVYQLADIDSIRQDIRKGVESVLDINEDLGYLTSHGCVPLWGSGTGMPGAPNEGSVSNFNEVASKTYSIKEVRLKDRDSLEGLKCLIVAGPKKPFTAYELFRLDQFLMKGKSLAFFIDSFEQAPGPGGRGANYQPVDTGLDQLLAYYGVDIKKSLVLDKNCYEASLPEQYGGGEQPIYYISLVKDKFINKELPFMKNIRGLLVQESSPLVLDKKRIKKNGLTAYKLFSSSRSSWEMYPPINLNPLLIRPPGPDAKLKSFPLAYVIEGRFTSYFTGKSVPQEKLNKPDKAKDKKLKNNTHGISNQIKSAEKKIDKGKPGKIFVIGTSQVMQNSVIGREGTHVNAVFLMNLIDYLNGREGIAAMRSKAGTLNPLIELSEGSKNIIKYFNIIGLPIIVILFGLIIWVFRHRRKLAIQEMFKK